MDRVGVIASVPPLPLRYTNVITRGGESIPLVRQLFLGQCAQVQMDRFANGNPYDTTTLTSKEVASESIPGADDTVVIEQNSTVVSKLPAADETLPHFTSAKLFGYARMPDGVMVVLQQTADQESQLDQSQFFALFHRTVLNYLGEP